jgi:hypothetical protein
VRLVGEEVGDLAGGDAPEREGRERVRPEEGHAIRLRILWERRRALVEKLAAEEELVDMVRVRRVPVPRGVAVEERQELCGAGAARLVS